MKRKSSGVIWGFILIFLGINIVARTLFNMNLFFNGWWTLFIIIPCFIGLCNGNKEKRISNGIGLCIGLVFLFSSLNILPGHLGFPLLAAAVLVIIGLKLISGERKGHKYHEEGTYDKRVKFYQEDSWAEEKEAEPYKQEKSSIPNPQPGSSVACSAIFSGKSLKFEEDIFNGAMLSVVFGGMDLDLRRAVIRNDVTIEVQVIFGGLEILVPDYVRVIVDGTSIFGGVDNKTKTPMGSYDYIPTIYINSTCVFGGIDVK